MMMQPTTSRRSAAPSSGPVRSYPRLWIDLDNSPHVLLFAPLIRRLKADGCRIIVTARDFAQTLDLVRQLDLDALSVGRHAGKNKAKKVLNLPIRSVQLMRAVRGFKPQLALSHGSRTQTIAARMMGVPSVVMFDYEWTDMRIFTRFATRLLCPSLITPERLGQAGIGLGKVMWYDGFKEDLYLPEFRPDPGFRASLDLIDGQRLVTVRPPGIIGNYHDSRSEQICRELLVRASADPANVLVILPKTRLEHELVRSALPQNPRARIIIPDRALPGLQLIHSSDLSVSGGGTMNREAALLGVPAYSMFTGRRAAIDEELARRGLLNFLETPPDVAGIHWVNRRISYQMQPAAGKPLQDELLKLLRTFGVSAAITAG